MKSNFGDTLGFMICFFCVFSVHPSIIYAETDPQAPEAVVAKSIQEIGKTTWFDPEKQSLVPIPLEQTQTDTVHRDSRWLPGAKKIAKPPAPSTATPSGWFNTSLTTANLIGWLILGLVFVASAAAVLYVFAKINPDTMLAFDRPTTGDEARPNEQTIQRMEQLPAELRRTDVDLRSEAERLMNLGKLDEAIKCLFGHQLLMLDRHGFLRLSRGKTNGRYVVETRKKKPEAAVLLNATVSDFEASYFGRHTPTLIGFRDLWEGNQRLESLAMHEAEATT